MTEGSILQILQGLLLDKSYGNERFELLVNQKFNSYRTDVIIKAGKKNIAAIEIKSSSILSERSIIFSTDLYFLFKVRYLIYTDGNKFFIYDRFNNPTKNVQTDKSGFVTRITRLISPDNLRKVKKLIGKIIIKEIQQATNRFPQLLSFVDEHSSQLTRELKLAPDYAFYFEGDKSDENSFEHKFFVNLLDNNVPETIFRYCPFNRAFQILDDNKIAMLGLPGMNDTTEPNYVDNYLNDTNDNFWELPEQSIAAINRRFIMSCTIHQDDLMQWRLYGDDAKGACIKFEINSLKSNQRFYLGLVKYANQNGEHVELNLLRKIISEVRKKSFFDIRFILLYVWRHFFKPKEYDYEGEVRLLYIHRNVEREKKWIISEPYSIVNPMVIFDMSKSEFPLKISEVTLGPKRAESQLNKSQLKQMLKEKSRLIEISLSKLNVYR